MKKILRYTLLLTFALAASNTIWGNLSFDYLPVTMIKVGFILALFEIILKPVIKLLLLPINFLTLGTFRFLIDILGFYIAVIFIKDFRLSNISTTETQLLGINLPPFSFIGIFSYFVTAITISLLLNLFNLVLSRK